MLFDAHAHLDRYPDNKIESVLKQIEQERILTVSNSMDIPSFQKTVQLSEKLSKYIIPAFGIHPWNANEYADKTELLEEYVSRTEIIGEIGLDYRFVEDMSLYPSQLKVFKFFLKLAEKNKKPIILHTSGAEEDVLDLIKSRNIGNIIIHWYSGPIDILRKLISMGVYFTVGVEIFSSERIREIAGIIPLEQLLTETDNPGGFEWLRREPGMPAIINLVTDEVSRIKKIPRIEFLENLKIVFSKAFFKNF